MPLADFLKVPDTPDIVLPFLTKRKFKNWLESKTPLTRVGITTNSEWCPIASFIRHKKPNLEIIDVYDVILLDDKTYKMPKWAKNFIDKVDDEKVINITARRALAILESC